MSLLLTEGQLVVVQRSAPYKMTLTYIKLRHGKYRPKSYDFPIINHFPYRCRNITSCCSFLSVQAVMSEIISAVIMSLAAWGKPVLKKNTIVLLLRCQKRIQSFGEQLLLSHPASPLSVVFPLPGCSYDFFLWLPGRGSASFDTTLDFKLSTGLLLHWFSSLTPGTKV